MELPINQDPEDLNKSAFAGKKWWQYALIIFDMVIAVIVVIFFQDKLGTTLVSLIAAVLVVPAGYVGLFQKNGLNFFEYRRKKRTTKINGGVYLYRTEPCRHVEKNSDANKKVTIGYVLKNIITGGKNID
jgi:hypothetical protein